MPPEHSRRGVSPSSSPDGSADAPEEVVGPVRKRAAKACLACRSRKISCDVTRCGPPCTRCAREGKNCLVVGRASRLASDRFARRRLSSYVSTIPGSDSVNPFGSDIPSLEADLGVQVAAGGSTAHPISELVAPSVQSTLGTARATSSYVCLDLEAVDRTARRPATVLYSHLPFLMIGNIHNIPFEDVNYLESRSCLHVPARPLLDNFVEQYFLHIHPFLPLIDEGEFWGMYSDPEPPNSPDGKMSLLLFQAMLFSSCTLLYDLETESHQLPLAQASLLLMSWVPPSNLPSAPYRMWLSRALQHAKSINADRAGSIAQLSATASPAARREHKAYRRLWWCCVIHDRISPLCTRFRLRITRDTFDFAAAVPLGSADLEDEVYRSSVYNPVSKRRLIGLFETFLKLMMLLTDVLELVFPFEDSLRVNHQPCGEDRAQIESCNAALKEWFAHAAEKSWPCEEAPGTAAVDDSEKQKLHRSEVLHVNLLYIYYYAAKIAVHHHLLLCFHGHESTTSKTLQISRLEESRDEVKDAVTNMTLLFGELTRRRLVRWLPSSAIGCMAMPLALDLISARLSTIRDELASGTPPSNLRPNRQGLDVLVAALDAFGPQYEGVGWVREIAKYAANLAQANSSPPHENSQAQPSESESGRVIITDWTQVLTVRPCVYLCTTMAVDLCISKGQVPQDEDFPTWLFSNLTLDNVQPLQTAQMGTNSTTVANATTLAGRCQPPALVDSGDTQPWSLDLVVEDCAQQNGEGLDFPFLDFLYVENL
ncbi:DNA binding [Microdochium nivale]|nr:DNA binding [Microdochium nivale]